jgi:transposase, IS6 family
MKTLVGEIILLNVIWHLKYPLSYRNLKEIMTERGSQIDHSTIMRWVHQYSPKIETKIKRYFRLTNDSWRINETYISDLNEAKYVNQLFGIVLYY